MKTRRGLSIFVIIFLLIGYNAQVNVEVIPQVEAAVIKGSDTLHTMAFVKITDNAKKSTIRVVVDGKVNHLSGYLLKGEYYFPEQAIVSVLGTFDATDVGTTVSTTKYYMLRDVARQLNVSFEYDDVLDAVYIWRDSVYYEAGDEEIARAETFGLVSKEETKNLKAQITFQEYAKILTRLVEKIDKTKVSAWKKSAANALKSNRKIEYQDGMLALLYAAKAIELTEYNNFDNNVEHTGQRWDYPEFPDWEKPIIMSNSLRDNTIKEANHMNGATELAQYRVSLYSRQPLFSANPRVDLPLSRRDAILAVARFYDSLSKPLNWIPISKAGIYDKNIITAKLLKNTNWLPEPTAKKLPHYSGFLYYSEYTDWTEKEIKMISEWGFNYILLWEDYRNITDYNVTKINEKYLERLDRLISWGLKYGVHINYQLWDSPGWRYGDFNPNHPVETRDEVELDLYVSNDSKQRMQRLMQTLVGRYKGIPNNVLSFYVNYEPSNRDRATGLPPEEFDHEEIEETTKGVIEAIRLVDPKRLLYYESSYCEGENTPRVTEYMVDANVVHGSIYSVTPYAFWSFFGLDDIQNEGWVPKWPVYQANKVIVPDAPLLIDGFLKKGTKLDFKIPASDAAGNLKVNAGEDEIYSVRLSGQAQNISFVLKSDIKELILSADQQMEWSELNITLPSEYTFERAWFTGTWGKAELMDTSIIPISAGLFTIDKPYSDRITISKDGTYKTLHPFNKETIRKALEGYTKQLTEYGVAGILSGTEPAICGVSYYDSWNEYYDDLLSVCKEFNISVPVDIWGLLRQGRYLIGMKPTAYRGYQIGVEYLKTLQKYQ